MCVKCGDKLKEIDGRLAHFIDGLNSKKIPKNLDAHVFLNGVREWEAFKAKMHTTERTKEMRA